MEALRDLARARQGRPQDFLTSLDTRLSRYRQQQVSRRDDDEREDSHQPG